MIFNEEQSMLQDTVRAFVQEHAPVADLRAVRANASGPSYNPELWNQLVELGLPAVALPEDDGGLGFGYMGLLAVLLETGKTIMASPLVSSVAAATSLIQLAGTDDQKSRWLPQLTSGEMTATVAVQEGRHYSLPAVDTQLIDGQLNGSKSMVMDLPEADLLIVIAKTAEGKLAAAVLESSKAEFDAQRYSLMDGRKYSDLTFTQTNVLPNNILGEGVDRTAEIEQALDIATVATAAEMVGGAESLIERTVQHLNDREQFDVKLATFQALQHRCAEMYCQLELVKSAVFSAFARLDRGKDIHKAASQVKALANDYYQHISNEAVQMHGGMGVTDELDVGLYLKRSRVCNQLFGDAAYHRQRYASALGL